LETTSEYGQRLKAAREKRGITLEEVSYELKINLTTLKKLEASDSKNLPKPGFTRGFIKAYCKFLKISSNLVVEEYDQTIEVSSADSAKNVLSKASEPSHFFILDFLKEQIFPLFLFCSVIAAAFVLYSFIGSYEESHSTQNATEEVAKMVELVLPAEVNSISEEEAGAQLQEDEKETLAVEKEVLPTPNDQTAKDESGSTKIKVADTAQNAVVEAEKKSTSEPTEVSPDQDSSLVVEKVKVPPPTGRYELLVEPLAKTYLYIKTSKDVRFIRATLKPDKIRKFKFDKATIRFVDAGAVNITFDGEDLGALGVFGEEKTVEFPFLESP